MHVAPAFPKRKGLWLTRRKLCVMFWNYARPTQSRDKTAPVTAPRPTSPATPTAILQPAADEYCDGIPATKIASVPAIARTKQPARLAAYAW